MIWSRGTQPQGHELVPLRGPLVTRRQRCTAGASKAAQCLFTGPLCEWAQLRLPMPHPRIVNWKTSYEKTPSARIITPTWVCFIKSITFSFSICVQYMTECRTAPPPYTSCPSADQQSPPPSCCPVQQLPPLVIVVHQLKRTEVVWEISWLCIFQDRISKNGTLPWPPTHVLRVLQISSNVRQHWCGTGVLWLKGSLKEN